MAEPKNGPLEVPQMGSSVVFEKMAWTAEDVARELNVSLRYVYKLTSEDRIPYSKVGRLVRFSPVRVIEWLQKGGTR